MSGFVRSVAFKRNRVAIDVNGLKLGQSILAEQRNADVRLGDCRAHIVQRTAADRQLVYDDRNQITFVSDRPGHDFRYAIDATKLENELGWKPRHSFEDGIKATVQWYLDNRTWWEDIMSGAYQGDRLGLQKAGVAD